MGVTNHLLTGMILQVGGGFKHVSGQIIATENTADFPQMVVNCKGDVLISGKSRLVKYYNLARCFSYTPYLGK